MVGCKADPVHITKMFAVEHPTDWTGCTATCFPGGFTKRDIWVCHDPDCNHQVHETTQIEVCNRDVRCPVCKSALVCVSTITRFLC